MMSSKYNFNLPIAAGDSKVSSRYKTAIVLLALFMVISASLLMRNTLIDQLYPSPRVQTRALQIMDVASNIGTLKGNPMNGHEFN